MAVDTSHWKRHSFNLLLMDATSFNASRVTQNEDREDDRTEDQVFLRNFALHYGWNSKSTLRRSPIFVGLGDGDCGAGSFGSWAERGRFPGKWVSGSSGRLSTTAQYEGQELLEFAKKHSCLKAHFYHRLSYSAIDRFVAEPREK